MRPHGQRFIEMRHEEMSAALLRQGNNDRQSTETICIGLDDGPAANTLQPIAQQPIVAADRFEIDIEASPRHVSPHGNNAAAWHRRIRMGRFRHVVTPRPGAHPRLTGITRQLAVELGPRGIRTNSVAPGAIPTEAALADPGKPDNWSESAIKRTPLGRMGTPDEVASAIAFLASSASSWINGQVISVDGGKQIASHDLR
jgi:hypothetical protein